MPRPKAGAFDTLKKLEAERLAFERRQEEAQDEAVREIGRAVLEAGGLALSLAEISTAIATTVKAKRGTKA